ncbi:heterokaryon incompatibility, partial [Hyaloscypha variabilis F]
WGGIKETAPITLNDTEVRVTTNLLAALQRLSQKPRGTYFWIDALCINQRSTEEKNYQVPLMRNIYQQAECVLMWLGKEADNSHLAMSMIETWAAVLENIKDSFNKPSWTAMRYFFERPYWRRIWIVQEVVLSRHAVL